MINLAFIKYAGMAAGGVEKYLQTLACHLPKDSFNIDFYYTDDTPLIGNSFIHPATSPERIAHMEKHDINLIKVSCEARNDLPGHYSRWVNTDFFECFDESKYDLVQTGRGGYTEFPYCQMPQSLFIDSIHSQGNEGVELRDNILKTVLISRTQADTWVGNGGDPSKIEVIPTLVEVPAKKPSTLRSLLNIKNDTFIFGMHQGNREDIFSPIPLNAYATIENDSTCFVMLGGANKYKEQAQQLKLKNCFFLEFTSSVEEINDFVEGLDVFAHGRFDGEVCSAAIIEALYHGKPCLSHPAINNGHLEQLEGCGVINNSVEEYASNMTELQNNRDFYNFLSQKSLEKWERVYKIDSCIERYIDIYKSVLPSK